MYGTKCTLKNNQPNKLSHFEGLTMQCKPLIITLVLEHIPAKSHYIYSAGAQ